MRGSRKTDYSISYLILSHPLPRTKMFMIASFISEKTPLLYDITYQFTRFQKPIIHWEGGGGVVGVNVKGRTLSFRSYLLNINHLFNLHHQ